MTSPDVAGSPVEPSLLRFAKSTQAALPLERDFWPILAKAMQLDVAEVETLLRGAYASGACLGIYGEMNPAVYGLVETLADGAGVDSTEAEFVRWSSGVVPGGRHFGDFPGGANGGSMASVLLARRTPRARWHASAWHKCGLMVDLAAAEDRPLAQEAERSAVNPLGATVRPPALPPGVELLAAALARPLPLLPSRSPWEALAERTGLEPEACRTGVRQLVVAGILRRFAMKWRAGALGFRGVMAAWGFSVDPDAQACATALASLAATGDVVVRHAPGDAGGYCVTALFLVRQPSSAFMAVERLATHWQQPALAVLELDGL